VADKEAKPAKAGRLRGLPAGWAEPGSRRLLPRAVPRAVALSPGRAVCLRPQGAPAAGVRAARTGHLPHAS